MFISIAITSCSCDYSCNADYTELISSYSEGDTIIFQSDSGNYESIYVSKIDSSQGCGVAAGYFKSYSVWAQPLDTTENRKFVLFEITKQADKKSQEEPDSAKYSFYVDYKGFITKELNYFGDQRVNGRFEHLEVDTYWEVLADTVNEYYGTVLNPDVRRIYWSKEFGLTQFVKKNGEKFTIVENGS